MKRLIYFSFLLLSLSCNQTNDTGKNEEIVSKDEEKYFEREEVVDFKYKTYYNPRFDFQVEYPSGIFTLAPAPENGDGRGFIDQDSNEAMVVYGTLDADWETAKSLTLAEQFEKDVESYNESGHIAYKKLASSYYVISGYKDDLIFYQKTIKKPGTFVYAILRYSEVDSAMYNKVAQRVFETLK